MLEAQDAAPLLVPPPALARAPTPAALHVREVDLRWMQAHRAELEALQQLQPEPTPFQSVEWLQAWWAAFGSGYRARVLLVHDEAARLHGVVPLMQRRRLFGWRVLEWMAAGRSDRCPLLLRPGHEQAALQAVVDHLARAGWPCDLLSLRTVTQEQLPLWRALQGVQVACDAEDVSPVLALRGSWEDYLRVTASKSHRQKLHRLFHEQDRMPELQVTCETQLSEPLLAELKQVEAASWRAERGNLKLQGQGEAFYRRFLTAFAERGWLELWTCRARGTLYAYLVSFRYRDRVLSYNNAYRTDFRVAAGASPGSLVFARALQSAFAHGVRSFDFLRGAEEYKYRWGSQDQPLYHVVVRAHGLRGSLASLLRVRLRWWLRRYPLMKRLHAACTS